MAGPLVVPSGSRGSWSVVRKRVTYAVTGILAFNAAVMGGLWYEMENDQCDIKKRGLIVLDENRPDEGWQTMKVGTNPDPDLGPCRGRIDNEIKISAK